MNGPIRNRLARPRGVVEIVIGYGYAAVLITHVAVALWFLVGAAIHAIAPLSSAGVEVSGSSIVLAIASGVTGIAMGAMDVEAVRLENELEEALERGGGA